MVARHLNGPLSHRYAGYTAWRGVADFRLDPDLAGETLGVGVAVGHVPMGERHTYWFATERVDEGRRSPSGELAHVRAKLADWAEPVPAILAATPEHAVLRNDLYDRASARRFCLHGQMPCERGLADPALLGTQRDHFHRRFRIYVVTHLRTIVALARLLRIVSQPCAYVFT